MSTLLLFSRVRELQAAKLVVESLLPFTFFSGGKMFKEMMATATGTTSYPQLPPRRVKHLIAELYSATKKVKRKRYLYSAAKFQCKVLCGKVHEKFGGICVYGFCFARVHHKEFCDRST